MEGKAVPRRLVARDPGECQQKLAETAETAGKVVVVVVATKRAVPKPTAEVAEAVEKEVVTNRVVLQITAEAQVVGTTQALALARLAPTVVRIEAAVVAEEEGFNLELRVVGDHREATSMATQALVVSTDGVKVQTKMGLQVKALRTMAVKEAGLIAVTMTVPFML